MLKFQFDRRITRGSIYSDLIDLKTFGILEKSVAYKRWSQREVRLYFLSVRKISVHSI